MYVLVVLNGLGSCVVVRPRSRLPRRGAAAHQTASSMRVHGKLTPCVLPESGRATPAGRGSARAKSSEGGGGPTEI